MGNLVCLNCFRADDEPIDENAPPHPLDKISDIKFLEDVDVISHFDLREIEVQAIEKNHCRKRSFIVVKGKQPVRKCASVNPPSKRQDIRYSLHVKREKPWVTRDIGSQDTAAPKQADDNSHHRATPFDAKDEIDEVLAILDSPRSTVHRQPATTGDPLKKALLPLGLSKSSEPLNVSPDSRRSREEEKDQVESIPSPRKVSPKRQRTNFDVASMKSASVAGKSLSFKSCNEFDNLTFASLISGSSTIKRYGTKIAKKELFQELMFEIEQFSEYFNTSTFMPFEEILLDARGEGTSKDKSLVTFCPKLTEIALKNDLITRRRVIISRGCLLLTQTLKEYQVALNKRVDGEVSRSVQKRLFNFADFDNELDSLLKYTMALGSSSDTLHTFRIATGKRFPSGKQVYYSFERSINLQEFFASLAENSFIEPRTYMIKSVSKMEVLNERHLKLDFYNEFYFPETVKISVIRKTLRQFYALNSK